MKGVDQDPTIKLGNQLIQLASRPDANEIYGLARNDKNLMAILTDMIGSGIQLGGGYSVSVPVAFGHLQDV
jgi:hypothetical protein